MNNKFGPSGFKQATWVNKGETKSATGENLTGICKHCNEWSAELKNLACKDKECIKTRLDKKILSGEAIRFQTDVINENGKAGTYFEKGKKKFFVEK